MTENKRFNLVGSYLYNGDECISHFDDPKHRDEIVELLNDFYNENEHLRKQVQIHKQTRLGIIEQLDLATKNNFKVEKTIDKLFNENEQLKQENTQFKILVNELKNQNQKLKGRLNDLGVEYYD